MSLQEGDPYFKCGNHEKEFVTSSFEEFNKHLVEDEELHTQSGSAPCSMCGNIVQFSDEPAVKVGMARYILCDKCEGKQEKAQAARASRKATLKK